jgi:hypothetical protein
MAEPDQMPQELFFIDLTRHKGEAMLAGKNPLGEKDFSDVRGQARHGPSDTSRRNVIVGGAAIIAVLGLPMRSLAYQSGAASAVLIASVPPLMLKTKNNPGGLSISVFDQIRAGVVADRSQFFKDLSVPFYGYDKPAAKISQGFRDSFWLQGMQASIKGVYDCIKAFSETDFTEDLKKIDVPTLILHGRGSDRAYRRCVAPIRQACQKLDAEGLSGGVTRYVHCQCGPGQCRSARFLKGLMLKDWRGGAHRRVRVDSRNPGRSGSCRARRGVRIAKADYIPMSVHSRSRRVRTA